MDEPEELQCLSQHCLSFSLDNDDDDLFTSDLPFVPAQDSSLKTTINEDTVPSSLLIAQTVQDLSFMRPLKVLFDTAGSDILFINATFLPPNTKPTTLPTSAQGTTAAGMFNSPETVTLKEIVVPEFSQTKHIQQWTLYLFHTPCPYEVLLGRDFLHALKIDAQFSTQTLLNGMI